ncbi:MAG: DM13 domain-containing protein [Panacibacter sp.]
MKQLIIILLLASLLACSKKGTTTAPVNDPLPPQSSSVLSQGTFMNGVHNTSGTVKVVLEGSAKKLVMEKFQTEAGPDLKVYLSNDLNASSFVNLGDLKSTNGNLVYGINNSTDLSSYKYTLIWCEQFAVGFGSAELK